MFVPRTCDYVTPWSKPQSAGLSCLQWDLCQEALGPGLPCLLPDLHTLCSLLIGGLPEGRAGSGCFNTHGLGWVQGRGQTSVYRNSQPLTASTQG